MGVVYKLEAKIKDFILEKKKSDPNLSCRKLATLILDKFEIEISKSSVNSLVKNTGLSMPVGRRRKKRRHRPEMPVPPPTEIKLLAPPLETVVEKPQEVHIEVPVPPAIELPVEKTEIEMELETECSGAILLKAADFLLGGSHYITEAITRRLKTQAPDLLAKTEYLLYKPLFAISENTTLKPDCGLWSLIGQRFTAEDISSYLNELQEVKALNLDISQIISRVFQEVRSVKVSASDGSIFYLDGQLHTVWSTPQIPYDFSTTIYNIKSYINKYSHKDMPWVLFMAPGYDMPTKEFFDLILSLDSREKRISKLTLYGNKFEELENIPLEQGKKRFLIFGLWPWQFGQYRRVKTIGEFRPFYFAPLKKEFYISDVEIELLQPNVNKRVTLIGCALKTNLNEKTRLIILTNLGRENTKAEELVNLYLSHWPNPQEAFQDFSRKIELFTYTASSQRFFSTEMLNLRKEIPEDLSGLFAFYLKILDLYVKWHFLPLGEEDKDFPTIKERFYDLKAKLDKQNDYTQATFELPAGYPYPKDLEYALRRINEREILFDRTRLWLLI